MNNSKVKVCETYKLYMYQQMASDDKINYSYIL